MTGSEWALLCVYLTVVGLLAVYGFHRYQMVYLYYKHLKDVPQPKGSFTDDELPSVTIQLPSYNERYVLARLIDAVGRLDYPRHLLEVQVLDDSTDDTTEIARRKVHPARASA